MIQLTTEYSSTDLTIPKVGEIHLKVNVPSGQASTNTHQIRIYDPYASGVRALGGTINNGETEVEYSTNTVQQIVLDEGDDYHVFLGNKYGITSTNSFAGIDFNYCRTMNVYLVDGDFKFTPNLHFINISNLYGNSGSKLKASEVISFENITNFVCNSDLNKDNIIMKLSDLKSNDMTNLYLSYLNSLTGDLSDVENKNQMTSFRITYCPNITGSVMSFENMLSLTTLDLRYSTKLYGELKDLFDAQYANGRTSGTLTVVYGLTDITYDGVKDRALIAKTATFTESGWTAV